jgi:D-aspartate ligase
MDANGLGIARTLGRKGIRVVGVDHRLALPGLRSKYVEPLICKDMVNDPDAVLETLLGAGEEMESRAVLFPTSDASVLFISRNRGPLAAHFDFMAPTEKVQEAMVNKQAQYAEAKRLGIPMTGTLYPRTMDEVNEAVRSLRFPMFIKPLYSHIWYRYFGNKGFVVNTPDEMREKMALVFKSGLEVTVQEIIWPPGQDLYNAAAYFGRDGYESPVFTWHKVRQYPPNFGVGSLVESQHQPEVAELGLRFMRGLSYRGIGSVGFKKEERDGEWKLIELNARTWMQNELSDAAGIPLAYLEYLDLTGQPKPVIDGFRDGVRWWDGMSDLDSFWRLNRRGDLSLSQWLRSWIGSDVNAYFAPDDPRPAVQRIGYGVDLAKVIGGLLRMRKDEDDVPAARGIADRGNELKRVSLVDKVNIDSSSKGGEAS